MGIAIAIAGNPRLARAFSECLDPSLVGTAVLIEPGTAAGLSGQQGRFLAHLIDTRTMAPASTGIFSEIGLDIPSCYMPTSAPRNELVSSPDADAYVIWSRKRPCGGGAAVVDMTTGENSLLTGEDDWATALAVALGSGGEGWALAVTSPFGAEESSVLSLLHTTGNNPDPWAVVGEAPVTECETAVMSIALANDGTAFGTCGDKAFLSTGADFQLAPMGGPATRAVATLDATGAPMLVAVTMLGVHSAAWDGTVWVWQEIVTFVYPVRIEAWAVVPASGVALATSPTSDRQWQLFFAAWDAPSGPFESVGEIVTTGEVPIVTATGPPAEIIAVGNSVVHFARNGGEWEQTIIPNLDYEDQCPPYEGGGCSCSTNPGLPGPTTGGTEAILGAMLTLLARRRSSSTRRRNPHRRVLAAAATRRPER